MPRERRPQVEVKRSPDRLSREEKQGHLPLLESWGEGDAGCLGRWLRSGQGPGWLDAISVPFLSSPDMPPALLKTARMRELLAKREQWGKSPGPARAGFCGAFEDVGHLLQEGDPGQRESLLSVLSSQVPEMAMASTEQHPLFRTPPPSC